MSATELIKPSTASASAQVRQATFADYQQIAALEARYGLHPKPYEEWCHLWTENPAYRDRPTWPVAWVLETPDKSIVGYIGNIPTSLEFNGKKVLAASGRGVVVDEQYRSYAFALFGRFMNQPDVDLILNTTVNANAVKLHELFRCSRVPVGDWSHSLFWITHYRNFAAKALAARKLPLPGLLGFPVGAALALKDGVRRSKPDIKSAGLELSTLTAFDDRFDRFWEELRGQTSAHLTPDRSAEILGWHFKYSLQHGRAWITTVSSGSRMLAYSIFARQDNYLTGLERVRMVDFQSLQPDSSVLLAMVTSALDRCRKQGIHMLEIIGFSEKVTDVLHRLSPRHRQLPCWLYFYKAKDKELAEELKNPMAWNPTPCDGDGAL